MEAMKRQPQWWEVIAALIPVFAGVFIWVWNVGTKVEKHDMRLDNVEKSQSEYRMYMNKINEKLELILIKMENKQDRKNN